MCACLCVCLACLGLRLCVYICVMRLAPMVSRASAGLLPYRLAVVFPVLPLCYVFPTVSLWTICGPPPPFVTLSSPYGLALVSLLPPYGLPIVPLSSPEALLMVPLTFMVP